MYYHLYRCLAEEPENIYQAKRLFLGPMGYEENIDAVLFAMRTHYPESTWWKEVCTDQKRIENIKHLEKCYNQEIILFLEGCYNK